MRIERLTKIDPRRPSQSMGSFDHDGPTTNRPRSENAVTELLLPARPGHDA
jgi:hypothetical protein